MEQLAKEKQSRDRRRALKRKRLGLSKSARTGKWVRNFRIESRPFLKRSRSTFSESSSDDEPLLHRRKKRLMARRDLQPNATDNEAVIARASEYRTGQPKSKSVSKKPVGTALPRIREPKFLTGDAIFQDWGKELERPQKKARSGPKFFRNLSQAYKAHKLAKEERPPTLRKVQDQNEENEEMLQPEVATGLTVPNSIDQLLAEEIARKTIRTLSPQLPESHKKDKIDDNANIPTANLTNSQDLEDHSLFVGSNQASQDVNKGLTEGPQQSTEENAPLESHQLDNTTIDFEQVSDDFGIVLDTDNLPNAMSLDSRMSVENSPIETVISSSSVLSDPSPFKGTLLTLDGATEMKTLKTTSGIPANKSPRKKVSFDLDSERLEAGPLKSLHWSSGVNGTHTGSSHQANDAIDAVLVTNNNEWLNVTFKGLRPVQANFLRMLSRPEKPVVKLQHCFESFTKFESQYHCEDEDVWLALGYVEPDSRRGLIPAKFNSLKSIEHGWLFLDRQIAVLIWPGGKPGWDATDRLFHPDLSATNLRFLILNPRNLSTSVNSFANPSKTLNSTGSLLENQLNRTTSNADIAITESTQKPSSLNQLPNEDSLPTHAKILPLKMVPLPSTDLRLQERPGTDSTDNLSPIDISQDLAMANFKDLAEALKLSLIKDATNGIDEFKSRLNIDWAELQPLTINHQAAAQEIKVCVWYPSTLSEELSLLREYLHRVGAKRYDMKLKEEWDLFRRYAPEGLLLVRNFHI
jgi:hypothetical protein